MGIEVLPKRLQAVEGSYEQLSDMGVRKELLEPFDDLIRTCEDILHDEAMRKKKHETGIQEARRKGIRIGRPPVPISMDFLKLEGLYSKKENTAGEAAGRLDIAVSTFHQMRKRYEKEIKEWKYRKDVR